MRNERVRAWLFRAAGCSAGEPPFGVDDRGVARDGEDEEVDEGLRSRPVTGGFLAAMVDMIELVVWNKLEDGFDKQAEKEEKSGVDRKRLSRRKVYNKQAQSVLAWADVDKDKMR